MIHHSLLPKSLQRKLTKWTPSGFTLVELITTLAIGTIIVAVLGSVLVGLLRDEAQNASRAEVQNDVNAALDFMAADLAQAVYVYSAVTTGGDCIQGQGAASAPNTFCPGLVNHLPNFGANRIPILAMWLLEKVPYDGNTATSIPTDCSTFSGSLAADCVALQNGRRAYTLAVYYLDTTPNEGWVGTARIRRYLLRKFSTVTSTSLAITPGYVDPGGSDFRVWPYKPNSSGTLTNNQTALPSNNIANLPVLTDFIDANFASLGATPVPCPTVSANVSSTGFVQVRSTAANTPNSFYTCVLRIGDTFNQSTFVYLRGNTTGKPGFTGGETPSRPTANVTILNRGVRNKTPSST